MKWSDEETEILEKLWPRPDLNITDIEKIFPNRSRRSISRKAEALGLKKKTYDDINWEELEKIVYEV